MMVRGLPSNINVDDQVGVDYGLSWPLVLNMAWILGFESLKYEG